MTHRILRGDALETIRFKNDTATRKRLMVPESCAHPAKGQLGMWATMIERYSQPGDTVLDPMAGSGATLLAALMGRNVICVELEQHFVEPMRRSWEKMRQMPMMGHTMGEAVILQGDARALPLPDASSGAVVTSPPFQDQVPNHLGGMTDFAQVGGLGHKRVSGYTRPVDAIVTSPPYEGGGHHEGAFDTWGGVQRVSNHLQDSYTPDKHDRENIGNQKGDAYWQSMAQVYAECWRVLKPGGVMALVLKGFTRDGKYVDLPGQTEALLLAAGWQKHDEWRRELYSLSFWRILQKRRNPEAWDDRLNFESVLAFRKPTEPLTLSTIASAFVVSRVYEVKDVAVLTSSLRGMVGDDVFSTEHVITVANRLKMVGIDASRVSAKMVEFQTIRDGLARQLISESMSHDVATSPICATSYREHSVSISTDMALPFPTAVCLVDLRP